MKMFREKLSRVIEYPWKETAKRLVFETPIEIAIGAVVGGMLGGTISYQNEDAKRGQIPLGFSEIGATTRKMHLQNREVPALTRLYSMANDVPMQVFEANNLGYTWDSSAQKFAYELEKKIEPTMRIHTLISDYAKNSHGTANAALDTLRPWTSAAQDLTPLITALDKAWEDTHDDIYRTEVYIVSVCTTTTIGKTTSTSCHPEPRTRQVYDHTIHYYNYNREYGRQAAVYLRDFITKHPDLHIDGQIIPVTETNAENEWAMRQSRKFLPADKRLTEKDYLKFANMWATGSNFVKSLPAIYNGEAALHTRTPQWEAARKTAHDEEYSTYSHHDDGPEEFQIAESALAYAVDMQRHIVKTADGIDFTGRNVPLLTKKIQQFVDVSLHGAEGDKDKLRNEVMDLAREIYARNFPEGFDTEPSKWWMVLLWGVAGTLAGAAAGWAADRAISRSASSDSYFEKKRSEMFGSYRRSYRNP